MNAESGWRTIAIAGIDTLWVRERAFKAGVIVGGVVGVVGGSLFGAGVGALFPHWNRKIP